MQRFQLSLIILLGALSIGRSETIPAEQLAFFESKIRPILADACYECHSNEGGRVKGGLALDTKQALLLGGDSGETIIPGNAEDSLLYIAIGYHDPGYEMPPKNRLDADVVADFKKWIEMGAPDPRVTEEIFIKSEIDIEEGRKFWSFQKPKKSDPGPTKSQNWAKSDIDRFVLAKLEEQSMSPAAAADPNTLVRRLYFDLIGLPPTTGQQADFQAAWQKDQTAAIENLVDQLLASEQYGERWGRHWMDVARYAESTGKETNMTFPHAWRYRDFVIDSFNDDKPYDHFIRQQVAGDLLPIKNDEEWQENLIATGFLAMGTKGLNQDNGRQFQMDVVDEQIDTMTQSILGLTVACARCHDHKFDPVPTTDYYALAGIFLSADTYFGTVPNAQNKRHSDLLLLPIADPIGDKLTTNEFTELKDQLKSMRGKMIELRGSRDSLTGDAAGKAFQRALRTRSQSQVLQARISGYHDDGTPKTFAMGLQDRDNPVESAVLLRGEVDKPAQVVERGFLQVLDYPESPQIKSSSSGRRELAKWLTSENNALTARVMANRVWIHLFGKGIVRSPDNFGTTGQAPTHPELLDHLAIRFMEHGWSVKSLIREIVLSRTYQMSSDYHAEHYTSDPENKFLWRANQRRLDAEAIRDAILTVSDNLDSSRPKASMIANLGDVRVGIRLNEESINRANNHRSVYLPVVRDTVHESLALFDFAEPDVVRGTRESTNVPSQALYLMNSQFVTDSAKQMASSLISEISEPKQRVITAFKMCYGRMPSHAEVQTTIQFFKQFVPTITNRNTAQHLALATFCQGLLSSAEFRYLY